VAATRAKPAARKVRRRKPRVFCYIGDLTEALGVTRRTVYKYVQERLLPAPILYSDGRNGVRCRWTLSALDHVEFINEQKAIGYNIPEIKAMVAARWGLHDKVPVKPARTPQGVAPNGNSPAGDPPST